MKKNTKILLILVVLLMIVSSSIYFATKSSKYVINEDVSFGQYTSDRKIPFTVEGKGKLNLEIDTDIEKGHIVILIISPEGKVIFEKDGNEINESHVIDVYKGSWYYQIKCNAGLGKEDEVAENGKYTITGELI